MTVQTALRPSTGKDRADIDTRLLGIFYHSVVPSVIYFTDVCRGSSIRCGGTNKLNKLVKKASSLVGMELYSVEDERKTECHNGQYLSSSIC